MQCRYASSAPLVPPVLQNTLPEELLLCKAMFTWHRVLGDLCSVNGLAMPRSLRQLQTMVNRHMLTRFVFL